MDDDLNRRRAEAEEAIRSSLRPAPGDTAATLFVDHHLELVSPDYWKSWVGSERPQRAEVLALLQLVEPDPDAEGLDDVQVLDFTLPGGVTDYVLAVSFDDDGSLLDISMES